MVVLQSAFAFAFAFVLVVLKMQMDEAGRDIVVG